MHEAFNGTWLLVLSRVLAFLDLSLIYHQSESHRSVIKSKSVPGKYISQRRLDGIVIVGES